MNDRYRTLNEFYDSKKTFREGKELRVLQLFVGTYNIFDISKYDFKYDYINDRREEAVLKKIDEFKPDIILTYDSIEVARMYYDHSNILYINENDYTTYVYLLKYMTLLKNEIHVYMERDQQNLISSHYGNTDVDKHIVYSDMTTSIIHSESSEMSTFYDADITIISYSNSSIESVKKYIEYICCHWMKINKEDTLKSKLINIFDEMFHIFFKRMDKTGYLIENEEEYFTSFLELANEFDADLSNFNDDDLNYLKILLKMLVGYSVYRRLIVKWVIEEGYKVALWGDTWASCEDLRAYYHGNIVDRRELTHVYNRSRICLFTNPAIGVHTSVFEMILSKTLCVAYQNDNETVSSLNRYFKDGESIVLFKSKDELIEKINTYLYDDEKRKTIIEKGNQIVKSKNLYREYELSRIIREAVKLAKQNMEFV